MDIARLAWSASCVLGLLADVSAGRAGDALPVVHVPHIEHVAAGKLPSEAVWRGAARISLYDPWGQAASPAPTEVLLLEAGEVLWIGFMAGDEEIVAVNTERKSPTYLDDCVEVFLGRPETPLNEGFGLEVNARGALSDFRYRQPELLDFTWRAEGVVIATTRLAGPKAPGGGAGYRVVLGIPWRVICEATGMSAAPRRLRANFGRWDRGSAGGVFTIWSDSRMTIPKPHDTSRYGWLVFEEIGRRARQGCQRDPRRPAE